MGAAGRDRRSVRHAADAAPQFRHRRRRRDDGGDAGRDRPLRRLGPSLLSRRGAGVAGRAPARRLRSRARLGGGGARGALCLHRGDRACRAAGRGDRGRPRRARCVRRSGGAGRAQRRHDPDRLGRCWRWRWRAGASPRKRRGASPMSTRISRSSAGARTRRPRRGARRAGARWRRRRACWRLCSRAR